MPISFEPWLHYPSLSKERLTVLAGIIRDARDGAVRLHDPEAGDSFWSLGCRAYDRIMYQVRKGSQSHPWLTVLPEAQQLRFTFAIGSIPLKFYRGDAEDVPGRCLQCSNAELKQLDLAFEVDGIEPTHLLRIAVEPYLNGNTRSVTLVEVEQSGRATRVYEIPLGGANVMEMKPKPITLAPVVPVFIETSAEEEKSGEAEDNFGTASSGTKS